MTDAELTERPGKGWTTWQSGSTGEHEIEKVWWAARVLHFPKLNVSCWFDGSDLVGIEHWGYRRPQWTMKKPPADHPPLPEVYRIERERVKQEAINAWRRKAEARAAERLQRLQMTSEAT